MAFKINLNNSMFILLVTFLFILPIFYIHNKLNNIYIIKKIIQK